MGNKGFWLIIVESSGGLAGCGGLAFIAIIVVLLAGTSGGGDVLATICLLPLIVLAVGGVIFYIITEFIRSFRKGYKSVK